MSDEKDLKENEIILDLGSNDSDIFENPLDQNENKEGEFIPAVPSKFDIHRPIGVITVSHKPLFPSMVVPLVVEGKAFQKSCRDALKEAPYVIGIVLAKEDFSNDNIDTTKFHEYGVVARIVKVFQQTDNSIHVLVDAFSRMKIEKFVTEKPYPMAEITVLQPEETVITQEIKAYCREIISNIKELIKLNPLIREELSQFVNQISGDDPNRLADFAATLTSAEGKQLQEIVEAVDIQKRLPKTLLLIKKELDLTRLQAKISKQIEEKISKNQREFFLTEQLKEIQKELGITKDEKQQEIEKLKKAAAKLVMPEEVTKIFADELRKLSMLESTSPEFNVSRNYLDWIVSLPWGVFSKENLELGHAEKVLNDDHYGLEDVKERILEHIATMSLRKKHTGAIICLAGPPGVGKTSIGKSIAKAINRPFYRFSVGGMRDEAEIKGHRRTYIGSMPGKLLQALKVCKASNPIIMLDEIDKIGSSYQGDPASALLEVLDSEQNVKFLDHYLDTPFDLSKVFFICTANQIDTIPDPLLDRMEVVRLSGYIKEEKIKIAKSYLIPKQRVEHGLNAKMIGFTDQALAFIVDRYAREAGVRNFENLIKKIMRKAAMIHVKDKDHGKISIRLDNIRDFLKEPVFSNEEIHGEGIAGCVNGLAWTSMGGSVLMIEAVKIAGEKSFKQSGQLGKVMVESSEIAYSFVEANFKKFGIKKDFFTKNKVHIHVPAGAVPKDGPSAGITMASAIISCASEKPLKSKIGMTGELTLTGEVLPIGGLKEKVIAAKRAKLKKIICPKANLSDYQEIPEYIKTGLDFVFVSDYSEVYREIF